MYRDELVEHYPRLFHMACAGSWPTIRSHGLWTTEQIVSTSQGAFDEETLLARRPHSVTAEHPVLGAVTIRDQAPLRLQFLQECLTDMTLAQWLTMLNDRVFFWLHPDKLNKLLGARRYRNFEQDVLVIDTASLLDAHAENVRLSPINSGATLYPNARPAVRRPSARSRRTPSESVGADGRFATRSPSWPSSEGCTMSQRT